MIRVTEIDGRIVVDNDPQAEAELKQNQAENTAMFKHLKDKTGEAWAERCNEVASTLQAALSPPPPPRIAPAPPVADTAPPEPQAETKEQRQDRRLQACIDDGLEMLTKAALLRLPDGVGRLADIEGVKRQSFSIDVKAAQKRRANAVRDGGQ